MISSVLVVLSQIILSLLSAANVVVANLTGSFGMTNDYGA
jgi:hypothetical protein